MLALPLAMIGAFAALLLTRTGADMTAVNLAALELSPCYDPLSHLIYAAGREHVSHVWVNGELLVDDGRLTQLEPAELTAKANHWKEKIKSLKPGIG